MFPLIRAFFDDFLHLALTVTDEENIVKMYSVLNDMGKGRVYQLLTMLTEEQLEENSAE